MTTPPAIALLEFDSIAAGTRTADAMIKRAPLTTFRIGTVQPGKFLVLVGGSVAAVEEARFEGLRVGGDAITDEIFLPDVHPQVYSAIDGKRKTNEGDALGIIETSAIPTNVAAADKAVKTAEVMILEIRLGDGLGGKGITHLAGLVHDVEAAIAAGIAVANRPGVETRHTVIPIQHAELHGAFTTPRSSTHDRLRRTTCDRKRWTMLLGRVIGTVVPCVVYEGLAGVPMLLIQPLDRTGVAKGHVLVAADATRMAGPGELIAYEGGREAALALDPWFVPVDHTIVGIVDQVSRPGWKDS